jgi:hypothetical protein
VRIVKELVVSGEQRGIREERKEEEFSPPRSGRGRRRTQRAQRWGEEGERKERRLKGWNVEEKEVKSPKLKVEGEAKA